VALLAGPHPLRRHPAPRRLTSHRPSAVGIRRRQLQRVRQHPVLTLGVCRVHFARNLFALVPKSHQDMVAAVFRTIFAQPGPDTVAATWDQVRDQLGDRFPKIAVLMDDAKTEVLAFCGFPQAHWTKVWSTNPLERVNKEVKRRARVVGIFPNEASVIRLVGAVLADMHDEWQAGDRRYLSETSMAQLYPERDTQPVAEITPGD
jgi:putative transposase